MTDDLFIIAFGGEDARDVDHGDVAGPFAAGGFDEVVFLNVFGGGIQRGLQVTLDKAEGHARSGFDVLADFFAECLELLDQGLRFIRDTGLIEFLNADINLERLGRICGDDLVMGLGGLDGVVHVLALNFSQFLEAIGKFAEDLLLLPF